MAKFDATLVGMMMLVEQSPVIVATGPHSVRTRYHQTTYESACGPAIFRVRYRNAREGNGRVEDVSIDGRTVPSAAELLDLRAARRMILSISIMNCGKDAKRPVFVGTMNLEPTESQRLGMRWLLIFRLTQQGEKGWSMSID